MHSGLRALAIGCLVLGSGCTSLQWAGMSPDAIRDGIHDGDLMQVGQRVGVVDRDGVEHVVRVASINAETIIGQRRGGQTVEIAIDEIVALRTLRPDRGRTTAATMAGTAFGSYALLILSIVLACTGIL